MFFCPVKCQKPENMVQIAVPVLICPITIIIHVWELLFIISSVTIIAAILPHLPFKYKSTASERTSLFSSAIVSKA